MTITRNNYLIRACNVLCYAVRWHSVFLFVRLFVCFHLFVFTTLQTKVIVDIVLHW